MSEARMGVVSRSESVRRRDRRGGSRSGLYIDPETYPFYNTITLNEPQALRLVQVLGGSGSEWECCPGAAPLVGRIAPSALPSGMTAGDGVAGDASGNGCAQGPVAIFVEAHANTGMASRS